jgi:predicted DNA binding CopG/RHH family protein
MKNSKKKLKKIESDPLEADLSNLIENGNWKKVKFELMPKNKLISLRLSEDMLKKIKQKAKQQNIDYQKFIRLVLEQVL